MCREMKDSAEFYRHSNTKDGLQTTCKDCSRVASREWQRTSKGREAHNRANESGRARLNTRRYQERNPLKLKAKSAVNTEIRAGRFPKASALLCEVCSSSADEYHHCSYAKDNWLKVLALCRLCHKQWHRENEVTT